MEEEWIETIDKKPYCCANCNHFEPRDCTCFIFKSLTDEEGLCDCISPVQVAEKERKK